MIERTPITELEQLVINNKSRNYLIEIRKWTFFLSIIGFVGITFLLVVGVFLIMMNNEDLNTLYGNQFPFDIGLLISGIYIILAVVYFFPVLYLFKFSRRLKTALATKNDDTLADALEMLKSHYKFLGVFMIIIISLYGLLFIAGMLGAAFA